MGCLLPHRRTTHCLCNHVPPMPPPVLWVMPESDNQRQADYTCSALCRSHALNAAAGPTYFLLWICEVSRANASRGCYRRHTIIEAAPLQAHGLSLANPQPYDACLLDFMHSALPAFPPPPLATFAERTNRPCKSTKSASSALTH